MIVVKDPPAVRLLMWVGFPLLGAGAGWLLRAVAGWVAGLEWAPFQGPFRLVASMPEPAATVVALAVGFAAGLALGAVAWWESLRVGVDADSVTLRRRGVEREISGVSVVGAFMDGSTLVLLGPQGRELAREKSDLDGAQVARAFAQYGYPWHAGGDPYADRFRRWVEEDPDLPGAANALLRARSRAVEKGKADDAAELRAELAKLDVVVRDQRKRQYWRRAGVE